MLMNAKAQIGGTTSRCHKSADDPAHVNRSDRQADATKSDLIMSIIGALKSRYPGDHGTARQDRSDMARELFGVPMASDLKAVPLALLQEGYARLQRAPRPDEDDVINHAGPTPAPSASEALTAAPHAAGPDVSETEPMDDETATEALLMQLERYAKSQGMTPAWLGVMQEYDALRLDDGALVLTADERTALYGKALALWPEMTEDVRHEA